jgi:hypothetical protein
MILSISAIQETRITDVNHWCPAVFLFLVIKNYGYKVGGVAPGQRHA